MILMQSGYNGEPAAILKAAENKTISEKLNDDNTLEFTLPYGYNNGVDVGRKVEVDGEVYVIIQISDSTDERAYNVKCQHEFVYMAKRRHFPNIASTLSGDFIGVPPYAVLNEAQRLLSEPEYELATAYELHQLGFQRLGGDDDYDPDLIIDFESVDKVTLWDIMIQIIACAGYGEIYYSSKNKRFGLVDRIGHDSGAVISTLRNAKNINIEYDITDMITVLYPYGKDDIEITNATQNPDGTNYIVSENESVYGRSEGFKNYDHSDPDALFTRALWEFDPANPNRIDVPGINISGSVAMIGLTEDIGLGDTVTILDRGVSIRERILQIKSYPDSGKPAEVSIGRPPHDLFFYLNQIGTLVQRYKNISVSNGKILGNKVTGTVASTAKADSAESTKILNNNTAQITIDGLGLRVLSGNRPFLSANKNNFSVGEAIIVNSAGDAEIKASSLMLDNYSFTTDPDGNLYFNGKMIKTEEGANNA